METKGTQGAPAPLNFSQNAFRDKTMEEVPFLREKVPFLLENVALRRSAPSHYVTSYAPVWLHVTGRVIV